MTDFKEIKKRLSASTTMPYGTGQDSKTGAPFMTGGHLHSHGHTHGPGCGCSGPATDDDEDGED